MKRAQNAKRWLKITILSSFIVGSLALLLTNYLYSGSLPKTVDDPAFPISYFYEKDCVADDVLPSSGVVYCYSNYRLNYYKLDATRRASAITFVAASVIFIGSALVYIPVHFRSRKS